MKYIVQYGMGLYGPYDGWAKAFWFAMTTFGFTGWRIFKYGE